MQAGIVSHVAVMLRIEMQLAGTTPATPSQLSAV